MCFFYCLAVASSIVTENTNWGVAVFVLLITRLCVVSSRMGLLPSFLRARLSAAAVISLSSPVPRCCFRALLHFVRPATKPSQDTVSMSTAFVYLTQTPQCQLTVEDVFWNATILHTASMTQPSQSALSKQSVRTGKISTRQDISVGYFVPPGYTQDTADASHVECVESPLST